MTDPSTLITPNATWQPGAWTPARCAMWHQADPVTRERLERWVMAEAMRERCHAGQLPVTE